MFEEGIVIGIAIIFALVFLGTGASGLFQGIAVFKGIGGADKEMILQRAISCPECANKFLVDGLTPAGTRINCPHCEVEVTTE
jgi:DNA-directed RNA polymerase subunit RPC12/RpoP